MGSLYPRRAKEVKLLLLGLGGAGQTTILYHLKTGKAIHTTTTVFMNVENFYEKGLNITALDIGGRNMRKGDWKHFFNIFRKTDGVIFVVDSSDKEVIEEAGKELKKLLDDEELKDAVFLVMANKQDEYGALTPGEVTKQLGVSQLTGRNLRVQGTCAIKGQGLKEGLNWMGDCIKNNQKESSMDGKKL